MEDKKSNASTRAKGRKDELKAIAEEQGQSLNAFVLSAIDEKINRLNHPARLDIDNLLN